MGPELIDAVTVSKSKSPSSAGKPFPPGFRFHPTDEELVLYYLKRKICRRSLKLDIIAEVDVYKWDPEELPGQSKLKTGDRQWFFFSPRDRKYPNGGRSSRATMNGYWKATGKDRIIKQKSSPVGIKKTLVYYQGRAPSGLRTDWVMHEYTMDEQELKRCPLAQEHYVLYKIFKKSGPGPKNGEQYGAPFVEEEWSDEDCLDVDSLLIQNLNPVIPGNDIKTANNTREEEEEMVLSNDIIELLNKIIDEPEILPPLPGILENPRNLLEGSTNEPVSVVDEDFLEMDDLTGPEPGNRGLVLDFNTLSTFDFYDGRETLELQAAYMDNMEYGPENSGVVSEVANYEQQEHGELPMSYDIWNHNQEISSVMSLQSIHEPNINPSSNHNQEISSVMTIQPIHEPVSNPSSGVAIDETSEKPEYYLNQCPETDNNNTDSWFSSALWSFIDSIPTTPASASESSALVNRAFERMSSFGRGRNVNLEAAAAATTAASGNTTKRLEKPKLARSSRGIVYFSVLGVLFAVLWVFVGSSIELLGRFVWW